MAKNGLHLITPTSIAYTGTSATVSANGSVTFSAVSVLSLNGVFTADYDNYMAVIRYTSGASVGMRIRVRSSGTDDSTASSYVNQYLNVEGTAVNASRLTRTDGLLPPSAGSQRCGAVVNVYGPFLAQPTAYRAVSASDDSDARMYDVATTHNQSTSYDGFSIFPSASNITGRIAVYGMRK